MVSEREALQGPAAAVPSGVCLTLFAAFWPSCLHLDVPLIGCQTHYCFWPNASAGGKGNPPGSVPAAALRTNSCSAGDNSSSLMLAVSCHPMSSPQSSWSCRQAFRHTHAAPLYNVQTQSQDKLCEPVLGITLCVRPSGQDTESWWKLGSALHLKRRLLTRGLHNNRSTRWTPGLLPESRYSTARQLAQRHGRSDQRTNRVCSTSLSSIKKKGPFGSFGM